MPKDLSPPSGTLLGYKLRLRSTSPPARVRGRPFYRAATPETPSPPPRVKPAGGNSKAAMELATKGGQRSTVAAQIERVDQPVDGVVVANVPRIGNREQEIGGGRNISDDTASHLRHDHEMSIHLKQGMDETRTPVPQAKTNTEDRASIPAQPEGGDDQQTTLRRGTRARRASRRVLELSLASPVRIEAPATTLSAVAVAPPKDGNLRRRCSLSVRQESREAKGIIQALRLQVRRLELSELRLKSKLLNEKERLKDTKVEAEEAQAALVRVEEELDEAKGSTNAIKRDLRRYKHWWLTENHSLKAVLTLVPKQKRDTGLEAIIESSEARFAIHVKSIN